jgi:hypothetical protein
VVTVPVEYIGKKDFETDHLYGTGLTWIGQGNIQHVPEAAWAKMKKHDDVWREAAPPEAVGAPAEGAPARPVIHAKKKAA